MLSTNFIIDTIFMVVGGLALFLYGMKNMSEGMKAVAGKRLRKIVSSVTDNRIMAVGVGIVVTFLIQSSSITTILVVGFVNSGIMNLTQAIGVILGANIGTTITGWILALHVGKYGLIILAVGIFSFLFSKNEGIRFSGMMIMGLGMIFFGMQLMKTGLMPMKEIPGFVKLFSYFSADSYFGVLKCAMVGCILTLIVQSSSATLGITMGLASAHIIPFNSAAALVLGENMGTTITAFLASIGATTNARRAAYAHIVFNICGVLWVTAIFPIYIGIITKIVSLSGNLLNPSSLLMSKIAMVHTGFNVTNTLIFLPLLPLLTKVVTRMVPYKFEVEDITKVKFINEQSLNSPEIAMDLLAKEQFHLFKRLPDYVESIREEKTSQNKFDLKTLHNAFETVAKEMASFSAEIIEKKLTLELSDKILNTMNCQEIIVNMEGSLFQFSEMINRLKSSTAIKKPLNSFVEGLDAILATAIDAVESSDKIDIDLLIAITADKSDLMKKMHKTYLTAQSDLKLAEKALFLNIINLFERIVWMLRKLGMLLEMNRI